MQVTVTLTEEQSMVVIAALELHTRVMLGQLDEIVYVCGANTHLQKSENFIKLREALQDIEPLITGLSRNHGFSISSPEVGDRARTAFDIGQVIRHAVSWHKTPEGGFGVWFNPPIQYGTEPLPTIKVNE